VTCRSCSLADCFAELPSIHSHRDAIRLPPPPTPAPGRPSLLALPEGPLREVLKVRLVVHLPPGVHASQQHSVHRLHVCCCPEKRQ
jgi:hypothetical protein